MNDLPLGRRIEPKEVAKLTKVEKFSATNSNVKDCSFLASLPGLLVPLGHFWIGAGLSAK